MGESRSVSPASEVVESSEGSTVALLNGCQSLKQVCRCSGNLFNPLCHTGSIYV